MLTTLADRPGTAAMRIKIVRTAEAFRDLEGDWDQLTEESVLRAPFYSWSWYDAWWRHFGGGKELFVIVGEDGEGRLQMAAPLMRSLRRLRGLPAREIGFLANSISPASAVLIRRGGDAAQALSAVLSCLGQHRRQWDMLKLWNLPEENACLRQLPAIGGRVGLRLLSEPAWRGATIAWHGDFGQYLDQYVGKKRLRGIRQKVRQLSERPDYRLREFRRPEEIQEGLELAFAVSKASWKGPLGTHMSGSPQRRAFYVDLSNRLARRGEVCIWVSLLGETPLAVQYQVLAEDAAYLIINDFQQAYQAQSPGTVLMYQAIERSFAQSRREFRFSGDLYDYKSQWATGVHRQYSVAGFHRGLYSRLLGWGKSRVQPALRRVRSIAARRAAR